MTECSLLFGFCATCSTRWVWEIYVSSYRPANAFLWPYSKLLLIMIFSTLWTMKTCASPISDCIFIRFSYMHTQIYSIVCRFIYIYIANENYCITALSCYIRMKCRMPFSIIWFESLAKMVLCPMGPVHLHIHIYYPYKNTVRSVSIYQVFDIITCININIVQNIFTHWCHVWMRKHQK